MKLSLSWIRDYVNLPQDFDLTRLAYDLTMSTVEVEGAVDLAKQFDGLVVGTLLEVNPHPNADKLRVCKTDIGDQIVEIVCGGINLTPGMKVAVALPGAMVRWHGEGEPVEIVVTVSEGLMIPSSTARLTPAVAVTPAGSPNTPSVRPKSRIAARISSSLTAIQRPPLCSTARCAFFGLRGTPTAMLSAKVFSGVGTRSRCCSAASTNGQQPEDWTPRIFGMRSIMPIS